MSQGAKRFMIGSVRWIARLLALLVSGPFVYFLLFRSGEVVPNLSWRAPNQMPLFLAWLAVIAGILLSWRWEMIGGLLTAVSAIAIGVLAYAGCGSGELLTCALVAGPYLLSGLLLLGCCWGKERVQSSELDRELAA
ncbi:MAG: hypothetical protein PVI07_08465 [Anaerolineae bacterium]|jgi:hypothetical protein